VKNAIYETILTDAQWAYLKPMLPISRALNQEGGGTLADARGSNLFALI
jgi:hypothetical protein